MTRVNKNFGIVFIFCLVGMALASTRNASSQVSSSLYSVLSPSKLQEFGVHLPEYMPTLQAQLNYQDSSPLLQRFSLSLNSVGTISGTPGVSLKIVSREQHIVRNSANRSSSADDVAKLIVISVTKSGEIRGLTVISKEFVAGQTLSFELPQDGQISRLLFLSVDADNHLDRIGQVELGLPDGAPQSTPKNMTALGKSK